MIELAGIFFGSFLIGFSGAVMPGPLLTLTIKESLNHSKGAALWLSGGHYGTTVNRESLKTFAGGDISS